MLRNGETGDWIGTFEGHKGCVWGATLNAPATHGATASADFSARLWNAITGDELHCFQHKHIVKSVCFSQDCQRLLTGGSEKLLRIYDLGNIDAAPYVMEGSPSQIRTAQFTANDTLILSSCADDKGIRVWDVRTNMVVTTLDTETPVTSIEITGGGRYITTADGKNVTFFDAMTFTPVKKWVMVRGSAKHGIAFGSFSLLILSFRCAQYQRTSRTPLPQRPFTSPFPTTLSFFFSLLFR